MRELGELKHIFLNAKLFPCAHSCKYCLIGERKLTAVTPARFLALVERFLQWEKSVDGVTVAYVLNYTFNYDTDTLERIERLQSLYPRAYSPLSGVTLGGMPWRDDAGLAEWLVERKRFGLKTVHASLAGVGNVHDYWNGRKGNFDLIMRTLQIAGDLGLALGARLFVAKSTLPHLEALNEGLERLPKHEGDWRYALPFFYFGWGARQEAERIDEDTRDALPAWMEPLVARATRAEPRWRSEREWIDFLRAQPPAPPEQPHLNVSVGDDNVEALENASCDEIVADYARRTRAAYAAVPTLEELCARYGDKTSVKVYPLQRCVETKWLDQHLAQNPTYFERRLTHFQIAG